MTFDRVLARSAISHSYINSHLPLHRNQPYQITQVVLIVLCKKSIFVERKMGRKFFVGGNWKCVTLRSLILHLKSLNIPLICSLDLFKLIISFGSYEHCVWKLFSLRSHTNTYQYIYYDDDVWLLVFYIIMFLWSKTYRFIEFEKFRLLSFPIFVAISLFLNTT